MLSILHRHDMGLTVTGMPKPSLTALAGIKIFDDLKVCLYYRHDDQLRQP